MMEQNLIQEDFIQEFEPYKQALIIEFTDYNKFKDLGDLKHQERLGGQLEQALSAVGFKVEKINQYDSFPPPKTRYFDLIESKLREFENMALESSRLVGTQHEIRPVFILIYFRGQAATSRSNGQLEIYEPQGYRVELELFANKIAQLKNQGVFLYLDCPRIIKDLIKSGSMSNSQLFTQHQEKISKTESQYEQLGYEIIKYAVQQNQNISKERDLQLQQELSQFIVDINTHQLSNLRQLKFQDVVILGNESFLRIPVFQNNFLMQSRIIQSKQLEQQDQQQQFDQQIQNQNSNININDFQRIGNQQLKSQLIDTQLKLESQSKEFEQNMLKKNLQIEKLEKQIELLNERNSILELQVSNQKKIQSEIVLLQFERQSQKQLNEKLIKQVEEFGSQVSNLQESLKLNKDPLQQQLPGRYELTSLKVQESGQTIPYMQKFDQKLEQLQLERNNQIMNETQKSRENQLNQSYEDQLELYRQKQKQIYEEQQKQENLKVEEVPQIISQQIIVPQLKSDKQDSNLVQPKDNEALDNNQNQILNQIQEQIDQDTLQALKIHEELNQHNDQNQYQQQHNYRYYEEEIKREAPLIYDEEFRREAPLIYEEDYINQEQRFFQQKYFNQIVQQERVNRPIYHNQLAQSQEIQRIQEEVLGLNKISNRFEAFKDSQIVRNSDVEWITKVILDNDDKKRFIEIYSAPQTTKDISNKDFIEACQDMTGPYIVLVMNSVGRRFGIYSTLKIKPVTRPTFFCDQATFIFSLDRQTFHFQKNWQSQNIGLSPDSMMILGQVQDSDGFTSEDLIIRDQQTSGLMSGSQLGNKFYYDKSSNGKEISDTHLGDQPIFHVYLIEVYEIINDFNINQF
eukprot:403371656